MDYLRALAAVSAVTVAACARHGECGKFFEGENLGGFEFCNLL